MYMYYWTTCETHHNRYIHLYTCTIGPHVKPVIIGIYTYIHMYMYYWTTCETHHNRYIHLYTYVHVLLDHM